MTAIDVVCVNFFCIRNAVLCRKAAEEYVSKRVCFASGVVMKKETALEEVAAPRVATKHVLIATRYVSECT